MAKRKPFYGMKHHWLTSMRAGYLYPIFCQEVTPGDTWQGSSTIMHRLEPLDRPAYIQMKFHTMMFFVPHSITWESFESEITQRSDVSWPTVTPDLLNNLKVFRHLGVGATAAGVQLNALPVYAYNEIFNEFFRDQINQTPVLSTNQDLQRVNFPSSDYFGGARTELQQGTEVTVDGTSAPFAVRDVMDGMRLQKFKERRSQYGERYKDLLECDFGIKAHDSRLERPELCAKASATVGISEVVATATSTTENTGEYRGHGIGAVRMPFRKRFFTEHGTLMGVCFARPRLQIQSRVDRQLVINNFDDLYNPMFSKDQQDSIYNIEVRDNEPAGSALDTWGYTGKYEWLRNARDVLAGRFALDVAADNAWHGGLNFSTSVPTVPFLQQVQDYDQLFQDQTAGVDQLRTFASHAIGKRSHIPRRSK